MMASPSTLRWRIMTDEPYRPPSGLFSRLDRLWTACNIVAPIGRSPRGFLLSITFDDVPVSAASHGAAIVEEAGARATYYIATGLLGQDTPGGRIVSAAMIGSLAAAGHEIGLHGHGHLDAQRLPIPEVLADLSRNRQQLSQILGQPPSPHFAYPYGTLSLGLKRSLRDHVATARGVRAGVNRGRSDLMQLAAADLRRDPETLMRAAALIEQAARVGGWLILLTHDVRPDPGEFGVTPSVLRNLLDHAQGLGARIVTVGQGHQLLARDDGGRRGLAIM